MKNIARWQSPFGNEQREFAVCRNGLVVHCEPNHRLIVVWRNPTRMVVLETIRGKIAETFPHLGL
jgi:hypothetical protein